MPPHPPLHNFMTPAQRLVKTSTSKQLAYVYRQTRLQCVSGKGGKFANLQISSDHCLTYCTSWDWAMAITGARVKQERYLRLYILKKLRFGRVSPIPNRHTHRQQNIVLLCLSKVLSLSWVTQFTFSILSSSSSPLSLRPLHFLYDWKACAIPTSQLQLASRKARKIRKEKDQIWEVFNFPHKIFLFWDTMGILLFDWPTMYF